MPEKVMPGPVEGTGGIREAVCVHTRKIYDSCRDKDCVEDLRFYPTTAAQEVLSTSQMIKGGGAALTREKIVADLAERFICIADESKLVEVMGRFPLPVEVIPMASAYVARELTRLGGTPVLREGFVTDNGNVILDVHGLELVDPVAFEQGLNQIVGVVTNGLFAARPADVCLIGTPEGVRTLNAD